MKDDEQLLVDYINATQNLRELLYDLDLLPGQVWQHPSTGRSKEWGMMITIASYWRANMTSLQLQLDYYERLGS